MVPDDDLNTKLKFHVSRYHIFFEKWKGAQNETATSIGIYKNWERGKLGKHSDPIKLCFYIGNRIYKYFFFLYSVKILWRIWMSI